MMMKRLHSSFASLGFIAEVLILIAAGASVFVGATTMPSEPAAGRATSPASRVDWASPTTNAASIFAPEKGKFRILAGGQETGQEEFEISASGSGWMARGTSEIQSPQGKARITGALQFHPDGTPERYEWSTEGPKKASAAVAFNGVNAVAELHLQGMRPFTQQFTFSSPRIAVLDNNLYHHYVILARLYDWEKKGAQTLPVLVPQDMTPGSVTLESLGKQDVNDARLEELRVKTEDLELDLYLDGPRLVRIVAPSTNVEIVRE
jgi:hypothetical protein